ncbi:MAG: pre-peptidase C-terminal domain-containing protein [Deltaproteobacteria bacterium]|nr:pre-peptidase C-terminal domain-containing protein [Deltaproteobacteria bacterium]MCW5806746.1 pre-peptidase C-terminal domain-containing protein [Deltaproteobacteria bacterium]
MRLASATSLSWAVSLTCLASAVAACTTGGAPELSGLSDQIAQVGVELQIDLNGTDPDGDRLEYGFSAADLPNIASKARVTVSPSGIGVFRWTPLGSDVGEHAFDFTVSDGQTTTTVTITIDVRSAVGAATAPIFRQPLGSGTTLDLTQRQCVELDVVIEDQDTATVQIAQEEPVITGATLDQIDGRTAKWSWCPTKAQEAESRYTLMLSADDGDNPKTIKPFLIVLQHGNGAQCPGLAPVITHTPQNVTSILGLTIATQVTDDKGVKENPLLFVSTTQPSNPPNLAAMTQHSTLLITGNAKNGQYAADVPNPIAGMPAGATMKLFYLFVAVDDDDTMGSCDHSTVSPVFSMTITSTGTANAPMCAACTHDAQCGAGDLCAPLGGQGANFCMQSCAGGCPSGTTCSAAPITSVNGASARQCIPNSGSCAMQSNVCIDDNFEENDTVAQANANPPLAANVTHDAISCPAPNNGFGTDDDFYKIVLASDKVVDVQLVGEEITDLDLRVLKSDGTTLSASTSFESAEEIKKCLAAGTYFLRVNGFGTGRNPYLLEYTTAAPAGGSCTAANACVDDAFEDDDTFSQARFTNFPLHTSNGNKICANDDDWFKVVLFTGEVMTVDLKFTQASFDQDLDLHLYRNGVDLTPCDTSNPALCSVANGQGAVSNEHTTFTAPAGCSSGCDYFVVVRGYNGSANSYDITIKVQ